MQLLRLGTTARTLMCQASLFTDASWLQMISGTTAGQGGPDRHRNKAEASPVFRDALPVYQLRMAPSVPHREPSSETRQS
jgi:hypothetical protein